MNENSRHQEEDTPAQQEKVWNLPPPPKPKPQKTKEGLKAISLKLPPSLLEDLKGLSEHDNIGYHTYIKIVLSRHVSEERLKKPPKTPSSF